MIDEIKKDGLVVILRNIPTYKLLKVLNLLLEEGVKFVEITMNTKDAEKQIQMASEKFGDRLVIGAGTVNDIETLKVAIKSGANYFLTPGLNEEVLKYASENKIKGVPGFTTASEALMAMRYGFNFLKLFPAGEFSKNYLNSLKGPLNNLECMAVGGVEIDNIEEFFKAGFLAVGIGSSAVPKKYLDCDDWNSLRLNIRAIRTIISKGLGDKK